MREFYDTCKKYLETKETDGFVHFIQYFEFTGKLSSRPNTDRWTIVPGPHKLHSITTVPQENGSEH